ncbi:Ig-like domain-containing domain [Ekhidna sp.]
MRRLLYLSLFVVLIDLSFHKCANPGRPTGGPKDTIPPTLIYASPITGTTRFSGNEITLEFSEYINADKLKQQLIITPKSDINYKSIIKRNRLIFKLEGKLEDSTTYNFNFANGVTDITEKNPVVNLSLAFSTGPYIDSMIVNGTVEELLTKEPGKSYVIGLYPNTDTLDYFSQNPMYFTSANDSGDFKLEYIKKGEYKILAFNDDNKNYILDPETESHGFIQETLLLDSPIYIPHIRCVLQNVKPIKLINARPVGPYVEAKFNKMIDSYKIELADLDHNIVGENKDIIRIYKPEHINYRDSTSVIIYAQDSLLNTTIDTIDFVFLESNRKPSSFSYSSDKRNLLLKDTTQVTFNFNKPIKHTNPNNIFFKADSLFSYRIQKSIGWNDNKTTANVKFTVNRDSLFEAYVKSIPTDTAQSDSASQSKPEPEISSISLFFDAGTFISIDNDTTDTKSISIREEQKKPSGSLQISLTTDHTNFIVQLINAQGEVAYEIANQIFTNFTSLKPATYSIRILIDSNQDGQWSYGNLLKNQEPEKVFLYEEKYSIRENWENTLGITF